MLMVVVGRNLGGGGGGGGVLVLQPAMVEVWLVCVY